ncbi:hypothetical protein Dimus_001607, partial [Dionaea muscipula]
PAATRCGRRYRREISSRSSVETSAGGDFISYLAQAASGDIGEGFVSGDFSIGVRASAAAISGLDLGQEEWIHHGEDFANEINFNDGDEEPDSNAHDDMNGLLHDTFSGCIQ